MKEHSYSKKLKVPEYGFWFPSTVLGSRVWIFEKIGKNFLDLKKNLSDKNQRIGGSGLLPPPLIRSPFTRSGIINAYVKASIMFVKQEKTESENQEIIKEYFDICNTKLDENNFERIPEYDSYKRFSYSIQAHQNGKILNHKHASLQNQDLSSF